MKTTRSAAAPPPSDTARPAAPPPKRGSTASRSFAGHLAAQRGLSERRHPPLPLGAAPAHAKQRPEREADAPERTGSRVPPKQRSAEHDDALPPPDGVPFRPLPSCVFAPGAGRALPAPPPPARPDVTQLANELLRSLRVGGERGRGRVQLVLEGGPHGEPLHVTLEESPTGVVATLPTADDGPSRKLVRAIAEELERRGIALS